MIIDNIEKIKKIALKSMYSDDDLMTILVLKGGNAIDLIYKISSRASFDLDFSIQSDFDDFFIIEGKIKQALEKTFGEEGYQIFDFKFMKKPKIIDVDKLPFWGGYTAEFKIIDKETYVANQDDIIRLRNMANEIDYMSRKKFQIEISKYEYCEGKTEHYLDGFKIYVYTPKMIVFEKIRAICQQTKEYLKILESKSRSPRAHDFFDIYTVVTKLSLKMDSSDKNILEKFFETKKVPFSLLKKINEDREFHRQGFVQVQNTLRVSDGSKDFDFYFEYVLDLISRIIKIPSDSESSI